MRPVGSNPTLRHSYIFTPPPSSTDQPRRRRADRPNGREIERVDLLPSQILEVSETRPPELVHERGRLEECLKGGLSTAATRSASALKANRWTRFNDSGRERVIEDDLASRGQGPDEPERLLHGAPRQVGNDAEPGEERLLIPLKSCPREPVGRVALDRPARTSSTPGSIPPLPGAVASTPGSPDDRPRRRAIQDGDSGQRQRARPAPRTTY